jgi:hypothetical protein
MTSCIDGGKGEDDIDFFSHFSGMPLKNSEQIELTRHSANSNSFECRWSRVVSHRPVFSL